MKSNINIGILGHVDSGKTTLAKQLSTIASTASFDKNPQSSERGITLDLGFSSFNSSFDDNLQYTLVDCPGHASLIKTIIGGAQIIDLMMLVIDVTKGIQTQTAECLLLGKILCPRLLVCFNKVDLVTDEKAMQKIKKNIKLTLANMNFERLAFCQISALTGTGISESLLPILHDMSSFVDLQSRRQVENQPFTMSIDHCFTLKGKGTILTGTVLSGKVQVDDMIQLPEISSEKRKVKSIQVFRKSVTRAVAGDRCGLCIGSHFDKNSDFERGIACSIDSSIFAESMIIEFNKIDYYKKLVASKEIFHISIGHTTRTAKLTFFTPINASEDNNFTRESKYLYLDSETLPENLPEISKIFVHLDFQKPILCFQNSLIVASKLDMDLNNESVNTCRLAFHSRIIDTNFNPDIFKPKVRSGWVDRLHDSDTLIIKNMFKKETNLDIFNNLHVVLDTGEKGQIIGPFGKSGKIKVEMEDDVEIETMMRLDVAIGKKQENPIACDLRFYKKAFSRDHKLYQF